MVYRGLLVVGLVIFGIIIGVGGMGLWEAARPEPAPMVIHTPLPPTVVAPTVVVPTATLGPIQVFVNGAVAAPDVYALPPDGRVKQAVDAAGGFTGEANRAVVNLALPLVDGMHIYVPELVAGTAVPEAVITEPEMGSRSGTGRMRIDINTADVTELDVLPGIGPVTAQKIIDYRRANGSFSSIEAIMEVAGIGEGKFEEIRELITVR